MHVFLRKLFLTKAFQWRSPRLVLPLNYSIPESPIAFRNNDSSTYNPLQPSFVNIAAWLLSEVFCILEGLLKNQEVSGANICDRDRQWNQSTVTYTFVPHRRRPACVVLRNLGKPTSSWTVTLGIVHPSFFGGLRLPCIYMIGVHVLLWRHWAVTLLHIKKTFLILHLRVNALFWCMGFQLTQCPAMFQNTKSGPLRDAIVEKAQNNCWEGPVKKRIRSNFWYHVSSSCCHIMQNIMKNNSKQLGRSLKDHLLFHLAISVDSSAQGACFESFCEIWLGAVSCFVFFWFASNDSDHHRFEIQRFCWHIRNSTEVGVHKL